MKICSVICVRIDKINVMVFAVQYDCIFIFIVIYY